MDCDWVWGVYICTKDRPRKEARPESLRGRRALHQNPGPPSYRHKLEPTEAGPPQRQAVWKQRVDSLNLSDEPKSWLESSGNLGKAYTTGFLHMEPAAARSTRSSCSAYGEWPKQPKNWEDPTCTRTLAPSFGKQIYLKRRSDCHC